MRVTTLYIIGMAGLTDREVRKASKALWKKYVARCPNVCLILNDGAGGKETIYEHTKEFPLPKGDNVAIAQQKPKPADRCTEDGSKYYADLGAYVVLHGLAGIFITPVDAVVASLARVIPNLDALDRLVLVGCDLAPAAKHGDVVGAKLLDPESGDASTARIVPLAAPQIAQFILKLARDKSSYPVVSGWENAVYVESDGHKSYANHSPREPAKDHRTHKAYFQYNKQSGAIEQRQRSDF